MRRGKMEAVEQRTISRRAYVENVIDPFGELTREEFRARADHFRARLHALESEFKVIIPIEMEDRPEVLTIMSNVHDDAYPQVFYASNFSR